MFDLVVEIRGGVLVGIYRKGNNNPVVVVDWDEEPDGTPAWFQKPNPMSEIPISTKQYLKVADMNITDDVFTI